MEIKIDTSELIQRLDTIEELLKRFTCDKEERPLYAKVSYFANLFGVSNRFMIDRLEEAKKSVKVLRYGRSLVLFNTQETIEWLENNLSKIHE